MSDLPPFLLKKLSEKPVIVNVLGLYFRHKDMREKSRIDSPPQTKELNGGSVLTLRLRDVNRRKLHGESKFLIIGSARKR